MTHHPLIVQIRPTGKTTLVFHPDKQAAEAALFDRLGAIIQERRGGHVYPARRAPRLAFRALRRLFGGRGRIADWTRSWRCRWIVVDAVTHRRLPGTFASHAAAVDAEVKWILNH